MPALHYTGLEYSQLIVCIWHADYCQCTVFMRFQVTWLYACTLTVDYCHLYSTAVVFNNILVMYRKRSSKETDAGTSSTSEDFDKPPWKYLLLCHCLIIFCGCQSIFDMERHCVLGISKIIWSTAIACRACMKILRPRPLWGQTTPILHDRGCYHEFLGKKSWNI